MFQMSRPGLSFGRPSVSMIVKGGFASKRWLKISMRSSLGRPRRELHGGKGLFMVSVSCESIVGLLASLRGFSRELLPAGFFSSHCGFGDRTVSKR
jgi:hypothetical protein